MTETPSIFDGDISSSKTNIPKSPQDYLKRIYMLDIDALANRMNELFDSIITTRNQHDHNLAQDYMIGTFQIASRYFHSIFPVSNQSKNSEVCLEIDELGQYAKITMYILNAIMMASFSKVRGERYNEIKTKLSIIVGIMQVISYFADKIEPWKESSEE